MTSNKVILLPLEVSPLIKLVRWGCLFSGVIYGFGMRRKYRALENIWREQEERERPAREAYLASEKRRINDAQMNELWTIFFGNDSFDDDTFNEGDRIDSSKNDAFRGVPKTEIPDNDNLHEVLEPDPAK